MRPAFFIQLLLLLFGTLKAHAPMDPLVLPFISEHTIPGMAIGLYYQGQQEFYFYGTSDKRTGAPIRKNTIFEIASITKVFTSTLLALAIQEGSVRLDDPVVKYMPVSTGQDIPFRHITLLELATHTSSLPRDPANYKILNFATHWHPAYPIGSHYLYSNFGFGLLGYILGLNAHTSYFQQLNQKILMPLNMRSTFIDLPREYQQHFAQGYGLDGKPVPRMGPMRFPGGGALKSTIEDMMQFLKANIEGGHASLTTAMQYAQQPYYKVNDHLTMGLGWQRFNGNGLLLIDKNGGVPGFSSYIGFSPQKKIGVVILINKVKSNATEIGRKLLQDLGGKSGFN